MTTSVEITDEDIARALDSAEVSNLSVVQRLGCGYMRVREVRARLGLPAYRRGRRVSEATWEEALAARILVGDDGHAHWAGAEHHKTPVLNWRRRTETAYRAVFRQHFGREPEGNVGPWCEREHCVAGVHLEDRVMREERRRRETGGA